MGAMWFMGAMYLYDKYLEVAYMNIDKKIKP